MHTSFSACDRQAGFSEGVYLLSDDREQTKYCGEQNKGRKHQYGWVLLCAAFRAAH